MLQFLIPGMQHAKKADLGAEVLASRATASNVSALARNSRL